MTQRSGVFCNTRIHSSKFLIQPARYKVTEGDEDKDYGSLPPISFLPLRWGEQLTSRMRNRLCLRPIGRSRFPPRLSFHYSERTALLAFGAATTAQTTQTGDLRSESESGADWSGKLTEPIMNRWAHVEGVTLSCMWLLKIQRL